MKSIKAVYFLLGIILFSGLWVYALKREHLLSALLSLEYISLGLFFMLVLGFNYGDWFLSLLYLVFTACEGALGISILLVIRRSSGGDYFSSFNVVV